MWGISWVNVQLMLADMPSVDYDDYDTVNTDSEEELAAAIDAAIAALGVTNMSGMGKVIQSVMGDYKGRVDGKAVSAAVKARLS